MQLGAAMLIFAGNEGETRFTASSRQLAGGQGEMQGAGAGAGPYSRLFTHLD